MAVIIDVGTFGWDKVSWAGSYYPEDLPEDWKLSYYGNNFETVVVSREDGACVSAALLAQWINAVDEQFEFTIECPDIVLQGSMEGLEIWLGTWLERKRFILGVIVSVKDFTNELESRILAISEHMHVFIETSSDNLNLKQELLKKPNIFPVANSETVGCCKNAKVAIINDTEFSNDLRLLSSFIQNFLDQNASHNVLYLYVKSGLRTISFIDKVQTVVNLMISGKD